MRVITAMLLSVSGAVISFLAVLLALEDAGDGRRAIGAAVPQIAAAGTGRAAADGSNSEAGARGETGRIGAFAAVELAASAPVMTAAARPAPSVGRFAASPMLAESRLAMPVPTLVRAAQVPPIQRRRPVDPALPAEAPTGRAAAVADAEPVAARAPIGRPPFDGASRSALGGPRPPVAAEKSLPKPKPVAAKPAAANPAP